MSLIKYGIAAALGYHFGQPRGRAQLQQLREQVIRLSKRPQVGRLQERGWDLAYDRALAAKRFATTRAGRTQTVEPAAAEATSVDADLTPPASDAGMRGRTRPTADEPGPGPSADPSPNGFGGRTVAEDSDAARTGMTPPPPIGRPAPPPPAGQP